MASSLYQEYVSKFGPNALDQVINVEFVLKYIDSVLNVKYFDRANDKPTINSGATIDFNSGGGTVYVATPGVPTRRASSLTPEASFPTRIRGLSSTPSLLESQTLDTLTSRVR